MADERKKLAREELERRYASGVRDFRQVDLTGAHLDGMDLSGADLTGAALTSARLPFAVLSSVTLTGADLSRANLVGARLRGADLTKANLSKAGLTAANLTRAKLTGADVRGVNLNQANLSEADIAGANLAYAHCAGTLWANVDLSTSIGVELIVHEGPSSVGIDTIVRSGGSIPDVFLRGCGVPEHIVELQRSFVQGIAPIQFYSCFISYSHKDEVFAQGLHGRLQREGLRVWFAPEEMKGGRKLHEQIDDAIRLHDKLLLVLSKDSMSSEWVATEISKARKRERKESKRVLFPIRLVDFDLIEEWECFDAGAGKDSAREIREYFIPDFSKWKDHDAFEAAFARLLNDLRASAE